MKINPKEALRKLAANDSAFQTLFEYGTLSVEIYKPEKVDLQQPHSRDEVYVVISGSGNSYMMIFVPISALVIFYLFLQG